MSSTLDHAADLLDRLRLGSASAADQATLLRQLLELVARRDPQALVPVFVRDVLELRALSAAPVREVLPSFAQAAFALGPRGAGEAVVLEGCRAIAALAQDASRRVRRRALEVAPQAAGGAAALLRAAEQGPPPGDARPGGGEADARASPADAEAALEALVDALAHAAAVPPAADAQPEARSDALYAAATASHAAETLSHASLDEAASPTSAAAPRSATLVPQAAQALAQRATLPALRSATAAAASAAPKATAALLAAAARLAARSARLAPRILPATLQAAKELARAEVPAADAEAGDAEAGADGASDAQRSPAERLGLAQAQAAAALERLAGSPDLAAWRPRCLDAARELRLGAERNAPGSGADAYRVAPGLAAGPAASASPGRPADPRLKRRRTQGGAGGADGVLTAVGGLKLESPGAEDGRHAARTSPAGPAAASGAAPTEPPASGSAAARRSAASRLALPAKEPIDAATAEALRGLAPRLFGPRRDPGAAADLLASLPPAVLAGVAVAWLERLPGILPGGGAEEKSGSADAGESGTPPGEATDASAPPTTFATARQLRRPPSSLFRAPPHAPPQDAFARALLFWWGVDPRAFDDAAGTYARWHGTVAPGGGGGGGGDGEGEGDEEDEEEEEDDDEDDVAGAGGGADLAGRADLSVPAPAPAAAPAVPRKVLTLPPPEAPSASSARAQRLRSTLRLLDAPPGLREALAVPALVATSDEDEEGALTAAVVESLFGPSRSAARRRAGVVLALAWLDALFARELLRKTQGSEDRPSGVLPSAGDLAFASRAPPSSRYARTFSLLARSAAASPPPGDRSLSRLLSEAPSLPGPRRLARFLWRSLAGPDARAAAGALLAARDLALARPPDRPGALRAVLEAARAEVPGEARRALAVQLVARRLYPKQALRAEIVARAVDAVTGPERRPGWERDDERLFESLPTEEAEDGAAGAVKAEVDAMEEEEDGRSGSAVASAEKTDAAAKAEPPVAPKVESAAAAASASPATAASPAAPSSSARADCALLCALASVDASLVPTLLSAYARAAPARRRALEEAADAVATGAAAATSSSERASAPSRPAASPSATSGLSLLLAAVRDPPPGSIELALALLESVERIEAISRALPGGAVPMTAAELGEGAGGGAGGASSGSAAAPPRLLVETCEALFASSGDPRALLCSLRWAPGSAARARLPALATLPPPLFLRACAALDRPGGLQPSELFVALHLHPHGAAATRAAMASIGTLLGSPERLSEDRLAAALQALLVRVPAPPLLPRTLVQVARGVPRLRPLVARALGDLAAGKPWEDAGKWRGWKLAAAALGSEHAATALLSLPAAALGKALAEGGVGVPHDALLKAAREADAPRAVIDVILAAGEAKK